MVRAVQNKAIMRRIELETYSSVASEAIFFHVLPPVKK
jgi:hypothetical protein